MPLPFNHIVLIQDDTGLSVSSGIFIPTLLAGAAWGRFLGAALEEVSQLSTKKQSYKCH